ncbi:MAG: hypothetical protein PHW11_05835 [Anaerolineaceae bacterium]|jgi:hypothetical protein|nr:hypothetical protein [Anaerolineaceae bacterium]MDD4042784.1 hypothetical protein [Anaerolineaceae bacterium]MDD4577381.1 hypothetical protein [Anaerolineaceae bacterium]
MSIINRILGEPEIRALDPQNKAEVKTMIDQLIKIGKADDFISLAPGGPFDGQLHHREAKAIGRRIHEIGGVELMMAVRQTIKNKLKDVLAEHLDHAWKGIGTWRP